MRLCICGHQKAVHLAGNHCWRCCNDTKKPVGACVHAFEETTE